MSAPIAVLSTLRSNLEAALSDCGYKVIVLVPRAVAADRAESGFEVLAVDHWDDYTELSSFAALLERRGVADVVTTDERCLRAAAFLRAILGFPGVSFGDSVAFTDKAVMKQRLTDREIPIAPFEVVHEVAGVPNAAERVGWPIVIKPRSGFSAINTFVIRDGDHFAELDAKGTFDRSPDIGGQELAFSATDGLGPLRDSPRGFLVERYVEIEAEYHCELLICDGDEVYCLPFRYPTPLLRDNLKTIGSVHVSLTSAEAKMVQKLTRSAAGALGLRHGFAHGEVFRLTDGRWLLGEVGARPGGAQVPKMMAHQYGLDVDRLAATVAVGVRPNLVIDEGERSVAWVSIPAPDGVIVSMTPMTELRQLPGVIDIVMELALGDVAAGQFGSLTYAGHIFCAAPTTEEALRFAHQAATHCRIETSPIGTPVDA